jgi:hypothetical protein
MIPEAHAEGGSSRIGIATMAGFAIAFILGRLELYHTLHSLLRLLPSL